jgi:ferric-dicitrate binding protein FerR (iron transport regulator)
MGKNIKQIVKKGKSNTSTLNDQQEMLAFFHQPEFEYDLKDSLLEELEKTEVTEETTPQLKKLFARIWSIIEQKETANRFKKRYLNAGMKIAAALILGIVTGILATYLLNSKEPVYFTAHSPRGSVSEVVLPDSTVIYLNSGTRIRYTLESENKKREVFLEGEAWFDVVQNKKRPFWVHTPIYDVEVSGTQFNVKAYPSENRVITTLEEGVVRLHSSDNVKLAGVVTLNPGEQAALSAESNKLNIQNVNPKYYTSWRNNQLIFMNMNLRELIVLLERKFGVDIVVKDPSILDYHSDGTFKNETIIEVLEIIKRTLPIEYEIVGQKIEITSN